MRKGSVAAVILAGGGGSRMGSSVCKTLLEVCGKPLLAYSLETVDACSFIDHAVIVAKESLLDEISAIAKKYLKRIEYTVTVGGETRRDSAEKGFLALPEGVSVLCVHDAARPFATEKDFRLVVDGAREFGGAIVGMPLKDTVKTLDGDSVLETLPRRTLFAAATPQAFSVDVYKRALSAEGEFTDDSSMAEAVGCRVRTYFCSNENIKITTKEDLFTAEGIERKRREEKMPTSSLRIGHGYDVHRLVEGRRLVLGGVEIPFEKGLLGHSDADVLLHAVADALLGAAAMGDIGKHFPDTSEEYRGADSLLLLGRVRSLLEENGFFPVNVDATLLAQRPKIAPYVEDMRKNIAAALSLPLDSVSVKATTEEGLGFTGSGEGMAAHAVCLAEKRG